VILLKYIDLALQVATELTNHDALGAHARDEIGIHENTAANPPKKANEIMPNIKTVFSIHISGLSKIASIGNNAPIRGSRA
jgi:hypothetical protein